MRHQHDLVDVSSEVLSKLEHGVRVDAKNDDDDRQRHQREQLAQRDFAGRPMYFSFTWPRKMRCMVHSM